MSPLTASSDPHITWRFMGYLALEHGVRGLLRQGQYGVGFRVLRLLGGSGVVRSRVLSRVTILLTHMKGLITLLL